MRAMINEMLINHQNGMQRWEDPAFTGRNPEVSEGAFTTAVVVDDDVSVVVNTLVSPGPILVKTSVDTNTIVTVVGIPDAVTVTV